MNAPAAESSPPAAGKRIPGAFVVVAVVLLIAGAMAFVIHRANAARPQLDVRNVGTTTVLLRHKGDDLTLTAGATERLRYAPGDALTIYAGPTDSAPSRIVTLEAREPAHGVPASSIRVAAHVDADDAAHILFRYAEE